MPMSMSMPVTKTLRPQTIAVLCASLALGGCAQMSGFFAGQPDTGADTQMATPTAEAAPVESAPVAAPKPPPSAVTAEDFDTTTAAEREAAAAPPSAAGDTLLGTVVVSLGSPADPGFWLETPLVDAVTPGRVEIAGGGASAKVELRPAASGTGSRLSLAAMRLLEVPVTDLPEVDVYRVSGGA
ncbi:hypothetical protein [Roseivivax sp. CAU 1753]